MSAYREAADVPAYEPAAPKSPFWTRPRKLGALLFGLVTLFDTGLALENWPITIRWVGVALSIHAGVCLLVLLIAAPFVWDWLAEGRGGVRYP